MFKKILTHPAAILFLFNFVFLLRPLTGNLYLSPADILQRFPSFNLGEFHAPQNSLLFDAVTQFHPWYRFAGETFAQGSLPLWNFLNGGGVPFLANSISALLFPPSFVFYFLDFQNAQIIFHFLKLFFIGLFTFLFLRELGLGKYPSLVGALAFNFAGFNIVWLLWPQTNVIIFLPLLFYLIEKLFNNTWPQRSVFLLLLFTTFLAVSAGHPETLFHIFSISSLYFLYRLLTMEGLRDKAGIFRTYLTSVVTGVLLSGVLLIPFLEYLLNSYTWYERGARIAGELFSLPALIYLVFPNISGNPSEPFYRPLVGPNYNELAGGYAGPLILLFSVLGAVLAWNKDRRYRFFPLLGILLIPFIYDLPVLSLLTSQLAKVVANTRLVFFLAFAQSVLAAVFLHHLPGKKRVLKLVPVLAITAVVGSLVFVFALARFGPSFLSGFAATKAAAFIDYEIRQVFFLSSTFVAGLIFVYFLYRKKFVTVCFFGLLALVFFQTGFLNINYNPAIEKKYFYPETESIKHLKSLPRGEYMQLGGDEAVPANVNLFFGLSTIHNYDALDIKHYRLLYNELFEDRTDWGTVLKAKNEYLDIFGIDYVLSYSDIDKRLELNGVRAEKLYGELLPENPIEFTIKPSADNLTTIRLLPANYNRENTCSFRFGLFEGSKELFAKNYGCSEVFDKIFMQVSFPRITASTGKQYRVVLETEDAGAGNAISFWQENQGNIVYNNIYEEKEMQGLELIHEGNFKIFKNQTSMPGFYLVQKTKFLEEEEISRYIKENPEELKSTVLLSNGSSIPGEEPGEIGLIKDRPTYKELKVEDADGAYLVLTYPYFPGWKVYVDGQERELLRGNYAFQAAFIPEGEHTVIFAYQPESFYAGAALSLIGLGSILLWQRKLLKSQ